MNSVSERKTKAHLSNMMLIRQRLYPYRHYLKWLRAIARWQMRFPIDDEHQWRFCRWVSLLTSDPGEQVLWRMPGTALRLSLDLTETIQANLYYRNAFQPEVQFWVKHYLDTSRIFIDAGANIGIHSLSTAGYYRQKLGAITRPMIYAFEPNPGIYSRLQRNIQLNGLESLVSAHPFAVAEREGWTSFYLSDEDNSTSSSLAFLGPGHFQSGEKVNVRTISLSSFLAEQTDQNRVGLIKLDIEGAELLALRGARPLLSEHRPMLIVEIYPALMRAFRYTFPDLAEFLHSLDYDISRIRTDGVVAPLPDDRWPEDVAYGDIVCLPRHSG